jgi:acylaminoacyl-peptidase
MIATLSLATLLSPALQAAQDPRAAPRALQPADVFELEVAVDPQISPDGTQVVYARTAMDVMTDRARPSLWILDVASGEQRPLVRDASSPRWSPDGTRLLYVAGDADRPQLWVRWMDTGQTAVLTHLARAPGGIVWSPDGTEIAFTMLVPAAPTPMVQMPPKPEGAEWAEAPIVIESLVYRSDGGGYVEDGWRHLFVLPAVGGTPRQLTTGEYHHGARPSWTPESDALVFSANRHEDAARNPQSSELYEVDSKGGELRALTDRRGPDHSPAVSPDGEWIAYLGYNDQLNGHQVTLLHLRNRASGETRVLAGKIDRSPSRPTWSADSQFIYFTYDSQGDTVLARAGVSAGLEVLTAGLGGTSIGRPYPSGSYSLATDGTYAYTAVTPTRPADVAVGRAGLEGSRTLTALNEDVLGQRELARLEQIRFQSSVDDKTVQGWLLFPPDFDPEQRYPLLLEIHGGPFANYGPRFAAELQLYAAAGYVVLYVNPRGSTSYGQEFANAIHHAYPGDDYHDLMSGVDTVLARGFIDEERLFVTGGSGGGVLTAWIVGSTDRFRAAVVAKPVINWTSFALTADAYGYFWRYWFPGYPWEHPEHYWKRSPLSLVGNVSTPTMLLTGEADYRTPISESEQYYQALQLRGIDTALVRIPGASHGIASRPSHLIAKVLHVLAWFERYDAVDSAE